MHVELTEARLKQMAKTLRADLGASAPSYQHTLDLLAKMLGYRSYESLKPGLKGETRMSADALAPQQSLAVLQVEPEDRPDWNTDEPLILIADGRTAAEAALDAWLDTTTQGRRAEDQPHRIEIRPLFDFAGAPTPRTGPIDDVAAVLVEEADRPDRGSGRLITLGRSRRAAEAVLERQFGDRLPARRTLYLNVHADPRAGTVGRRGERLSATPTGRPANLLFKGLDPVMDGTRLYGRPTYYDCGICGHHHPADWDGDCRDDNNRFTLDQLDARHGENGWEEVEMSEPDLEIVHHPRTGREHEVTFLQADDALFEDAYDRLSAHPERHAVRYDVTPAPAHADEPGTPEIEVYELDDRGMNVAQPAPRDPEPAPGESVPAAVRDVLVNLHRELGGAPERTAVVYVDHGRAFAFPSGDPSLAGGPDESPVPVVALYRWRDERDETIREVDRTLSNLLIEIDRDW